MEIISLILTIAVAFVIAVIITKFEIPILRQKAGQNIREEGLESHYAKAGTPSMGGISFIIAACITTLVMTAVFGGNFSHAVAILIIFVGFGVIGFIDDYLKVIKKQNEGLRAKQKFALQIVLSVIFAVIVTNISDYGTQVYFPIVDTFVNFGFFYYIFVVFAVLAMTNAVNLTDGLDGLASGVTALVTLFFAIAGMIFGTTHFVDNANVIFFAAVCGGCLGFLVFNKNPAKVFMGDTGSLALGGGIAAAAIAMKLELLLLVAGLLYVIEALSVVLQVTYFKATHGKRIFKMAPIHHHFEMCGFSERQVVIGFWLFTFVCCIAAMFMI
ncbi:MAG: phospho-N-acetylmuramoyl-pentapeptide-transferase [Firmicutes bacterium]|nr:phospho-N-acetylmuramoyl-pentapeptide-transferase [Bacillota bacterium]